MIAVSVIVPVYNASKYLDRCMQSLLNQTLKNIEILLIDDGSTDGSERLCDEYVLKDDRVIAVHQTNKGAAAARNAGLTIAKGQFIGFVDADDFVEIDMYQKMYEQAKKMVADIVFCNLYTNTTKMKPYLKSGLYEGKSLESVIFPRLISVLNERNGEKVLRGSVCCKLFKKDLLEKNNIWFKESLIYNEDGLFSISSTLKCERYLYMGEAYFYHRTLIEGSVTKRYIDKLWEIQRNMKDDLLHIVQDCSYDFSKQIAKKYFEIAIYCIENEAKRSNKKSVINKMRNIKLIVDECNMSHYLQEIDASQLDKINRFYYKAMKIKVPLVLLFGAKYRYRKNKLF